MLSLLKFKWEDFPAKSIRGKVPFGYKRNNVDPTIFNPDYDLVPLIEEALISLDNGKSLRDASAWLTVAANKPISHAGLKMIWDRVVENKDDTFRKERLATIRTPKTRAEKKARRIADAKGQARRRITVNQKTLNRLNGLEEGLKSSAKGALSEGRTNGDSNSGTSIESLDVRNDLEVPADVIFRPNPGPQTEFLNSTDLEVLYGGAAGGGKSFALLADPMRYFHHPKFNGLLLRRTNDELRDLINESRFLYSKAFKGAKWSSQDKTWTFPSGARFWMTYLERDEDVLRYQGQAFTWIGMDELTQYSTPYAWNYLRSRLRTSAQDLPLSMRGTCNPGGPGHQWVKKMFIDPAPPNLAFAARDHETGERLVYPKGHAKEGQVLFRRKFIPARLSDNPYLTQDGQYEASLLSLPEHQRRQLLEGDWTIAEGAAFPEFSTNKHVVEPFEIPHSWRRFRSCDFGYSSASAVLWFAIDPVLDRLVCYRELYVSKHTGRDLARRIIQIEMDSGERISYGMLDSSTFHQRGNSGPVISEEMAGEGVRFRPSDRGHGSRIAGRNRLHELLKLHDIGDGYETPGIIFFNTCRQIIADLQTIPTDPKGGEDIDDRFASDHTYDALRYGIMSRPKPGGFYEALATPTTRTNNNQRPSDNVFGY